MASTHQHAAIVTVGSELTLGLRLDTNTQEIAATLAAAGYRVREALSVPDDIEILAEEIARLTDAMSFVVVTGGLGPTHDDVTREAAARALELSLVRDPELEKSLRERISHHVDPAAVEGVLAQADVIWGAHVIQPIAGTAPGQLIETGSSQLLLLPGPPHEMRPMLAEVVKPTGDAVSLALRCVGIGESDAQLRTQEVLVAHPGVELTVLASPSLVDLVLVANDAGESELAAAAADVRAALGTLVYGEGDATLAATVLEQARTLGVTIAAAESCTGGLIGAALTDIPGASDVFVGGVVAYADAVKGDLLGVDAATLAAHGAVSEQVAAEMASGVARATGADFAVSTTGIAGPSGGTDAKPVGLVCFAVWTAHVARAESRELFGDREGIRIRSTVAALDLLRLETL